MAKKKKASSAERKLTSEIKQLRTKLGRADARTEKAKARARSAEKAARAEHATAAKLSKKLEKLTSTRSEPSTGGGTSEAPSAPVTPDSSWTVVRLRDEARARGLTGVSGKTKAQLLAMLG